MAILSKALRLAAWKHGAADVEPRQSGEKAWRAGQDQWMGSSFHVNWSLRLQ